MIMDISTIKFLAILLILTLPFRHIIRKLLWGREISWKFVVTEWLVLFVFVATILFYKIHR